MWLMGCGLVWRSRADAEYAILISESLVFRTVFCVFYPPRRCKEWLRRHAPEYFPDLFPDEIAARLEAIRLAEESGSAVVMPGADEEEEDAVKVAVPIEQKTSGGKKKKAPAEIVLMLGQRKGKKQVTIVYGLDLFGIKLKDAARAAKKKFATGSSIAVVCCSFGCVL